MTDNASQADDAAFELPQRRRVRTVMREVIDFLRKLLQFAINPR